ncbi:SH3 domain-containing protein [Leptospira alstonii]|uniref:SH3 domain-containing protein n=1 Tax=Leptospira alstonii TaxID=28452 RepID=UPI001F18E117|nr:SH3 domain-containing protein [Leptospira alstonii]
MAHNVYRHFLLIILLAFVLFQSCRTKEPIGKGYVLTDGLCIHKDPTYKSECAEKLERGKSVKILEYKIRDKEKKSNLLWYRILSDKTDGFISLDEEINKGSFATIFPTNKNTLYVDASSLRVRSLPSLSGDIIESLPKGTAVSLLGNTPFKIKIENKYDGWSEVQIPSGKIGFSYSGFLIHNTSTNVVTNSKSLPGIFVLYNDKATIWSEPGTKAGQLNTCNSENLEKYLNIIDATTVNNVKYYLVNRRINYYGFNSLEPMGCINGWIAETEGDPIEDFYEWSLKEYGGNFDPDLIEIIHNSGGHFQDLRTLQVNELGNSGKKGESLYEVSYDELDSDFNQSERIRRLYGKTKDGYFVLLDHLGGESYSEDFDKDGINEWVVKTSLRSGEQTIYYTRKENSLVPFLKVEDSDFNFCGIKINDMEEIGINVSPEEAQGINCTIDTDGAIFTFNIQNKKSKYKLLKGMLVQTRK